MITTANATRTRRIICATRKETLVKVVQVGECARVLVRREDNYDDGHKIVRWDVISSYGPYYDKQHTSICRTRKDALAAIDRPAARKADLSSKERLAELLAH